jgi:hypothetical protein
MSALALEIAGDGVSVLREAGDAYREPAFALLEGAQIITGEAARQQFRIRPRQVHLRFWDQLGEEDLPGTGVSNADLGHAQLEAVWQRCGEGVEAAYLVAPDSYSREQLGLLLGLAQECAIPVAGIVPCSVASSTRCAPERQLIHVDAGLSSFIVSVIEQGESLRRGREARLPAVGLETLRDTWIRFIGESFLSATRFDPFHDAASEQALFEQMPYWLAAIADAPVTLVLEYQGKCFETRVQPVDLIGAVEAPYRALQQLVASVREPGRAAVIQLSERLSALPGLAAAMGRLGEAQVIGLTPGSATRGALARLVGFARGAESIVLTRGLPPCEPPLTAEAPLEMPAAQPASRGPDTRPTHVVWQGVAHALSAAALTVGTANGTDGEPVLVIPPGTSGVSARHCELRLLEDGAFLTDLSRYGTFVNGRRADSQTRLQPGDVLRIGMPGEELLMIMVA